MNESQETPQPEQGAQGPQDHTGDGMELDQILCRCLDSAGYLVFAAFLTPRRDPEGNNIIDFQYRRYHLSLEDAKQAVSALKTFVDKEIERLIQEMNAEGGSDEQN